MKVRENNRDERDSYLRPLIFYIKSGIASSNFVRVSYFLALSLSIRKIVIKVCIF